MKIYILFAMLLLMAALTPAASAADFDVFDYFEPTASYSVEDEDGQVVVEHIELTPEDYLEYLSMSADVEIPKEILEADETPMGKVSLFSKYLIESEAKQSVYSTRSVSCGPVASGDIGWCSLYSTVVFVSTSGVRSEVDEDTWNYLRSWTVEAWKNGDLKNANWEFSWTQPTGIGQYKYWPAYAQSVQCTDNSDYDACYDTWVLYAKPLNSVGGNCTVGPWNTGSMNYSYSDACP